MNNKFNNRTLLLIFIGLAALFTLSRLSRVREGDRSLMSELAVIDTSRVSTFSIFPASESGREIKFTREGPDWRIASGDLNAPASSQAVRSLLAEIGSLEAEQLVARDPDRWVEFQVVDSLGTRILIKEGSRVVVDLIAGRFQYQPPPQGNYNMYGQNQGSGRTYIRLSGEDEVYSVDGFFALSVNQGFDRWRDQTLSRINKTALSRIRFDYPADSGYVAQNAESGWMVAGLPADSASMDHYLNRITRTSLTEFEDSYRPVGDADYRLTLEGDQFKPVVIRAFSAEDSTFVINSSQNPESWFRVGDLERFSGIFPGSSSLLPEGR